MTAQRRHSLPLHRVLRPLAALAVMLLTACAKDIPRFTPPAERPVLASEQPWQSGQFLAIAYHDVEDANPDQHFVGITTGQLIEQLHWLYENGYQAVSIDQILDARAGRAPLPDKAVLLSFDDGYGSFYTRVLPILRAWNWPAVLAPVGVWMDAPADAPIDFGGLAVARERFLNWNRIAEIARSGLVEIAAHTDRSHYGILANPQGNTQPAAAARAWLPALDRYETDAEFHARMRADMTAISAKIRRATGRAPRVWVWPYGEASGASLNIVAENGYHIALTLEPGLSHVQRLHSAARVMPVNAPALPDFSSDLVAAENAPFMRMVHIDLDTLYDPDPEHIERNLSTLVQRIYDLRPNAVFLQASAQPEGDGVVRAVYFPNRHLPMRTDLFNRVAWQLRNRAQVKIYAAMPVLALDITREKVGELYEDLAKHAIFDGLLFHDDAQPGVTADASAATLTAFTQELAAQVRAIRGPHMQTARSLSADALLNPQAEGAQPLGEDLDKLLAAYDWIAPMVAPPPDQAHAWLDALVDAIAARPGALDKTVFTLQTRNGRTSAPQPGDGRIDTHALAGWMQRLQLRGARSVGYAPDDFVNDHPRRKDVRPAMSAAWYPFQENDHD